VSALLLFQLLELNRKALEMCSEVFLMMFSERFRGTGCSIHGIFVHGIVLNCGL